MVDPSTTQRTSERWQKPLTNFMKLNVDGAIFANQHHARIGMVLHNDQRAFCFSACVGLHEVNELIEIELMAILRELQLCASMGISKLLVESNYLLMIKLCNKENAKNSKFGVLVSEIKNIQSRFEE